MNTNTLFTLLEQNKEDTSLLKDLIETYSDIINNPIGVDLEQFIIVRAAARGYQILVEKLIKCPKININAQNSSHDTALISAVYNDYPKIAIILINAGADITLQDDQKNNALDYINHIKDENSKTQIKHLIEEQLAEKKPTIFESPKEKRITTAVLGSLLLKHKTNVGLVTALINAHKDLISQPVAIYANLLFMAIRQHSEIIAKALILVKIDLDYKTMNNITALIYAMNNNAPNIAIQLIEAGIDITVKDHNGWAAYDLIDNIKDEAKRNEIRKLLESKMPKPEEIKPTPEPEEVKPIETHKPEETSKPVACMSGEGTYITPGSSNAVKTESVASKLIKYLSSNNIDYSFSNNEITIETNGEFVAFALENNIPYKVSGNKITIALK